MNHLRELARLPVRGDRFIRRGDQVLVAKLYGSPPHALTVVDIASPATPRVLSATPFAYPMQSLASVGGLLYVFESERAIHLVRIDENPPATPDCHLMFRKQLYELHPLGERWLVGAANFDGVVLLDVSNPAVPREASWRKLGDSYVESIAIAGSRIFAAGHRDGLVELSVDSNGALVERSRRFGGDDGFTVQRVFVVGDHLWVFGDGALPYGGDEDANTVVFALSDLETPVWSGASPTMPKRMRALPDGGAITLDGYRCYRYPAAGAPELLFELRETAGERSYVEVNATTAREALPHHLGIADDATCWMRRGEHLFVQRADELAIYVIAPDSPLAQIEAD